MSGPYPPDPPPHVRKPTVVRSVVRHTACGVCTTMPLETAASVSRHPEYHGRLWCDGCARWCERLEFEWKGGGAV